MPQPISTPKLSNLSQTGLIKGKFHWPKGAKEWSRLGAQVVRELGIGLLQALIGEVLVWGIILLMLLIYCVFNP